MRVDLLVPNWHWRRGKFWEPRYLRVEVDIPAANMIDCCFRDKTS